MTQRGHLFRADVDREGARRTRMRFGLGSVVYPVLLGLSFVSAVATLCLHAALALYYAFNQLPVPTTGGGEYTAGT